MSSGPSLNHALPLPPSHLSRLPSFAPSTASSTTGNNLLRHLENGNNLYINVQPACENVLRDSAFYKPPIPPLLNAEPPDRRLFSRLPISLDATAKFTFVCGLYLALYGLLVGLNNIIAPAPTILDDFFSVLNTLTITWGVFFSSSCLFGLSLLYSKWRRSPAAALFFMILWAFTVLLLIVVAALWFYFFHALKIARMERCRAKTVKTGEAWDWDAPRRAAPSADIDACLAGVLGRTIMPLVWGCLYVVLVMLGVATSVWSRRYRRRLMEVEEWKRLQKEMGGEKVGLVIGTAPLGMSRGTLGGRRSGDSGGGGGGSEVASPSSTYGTDGSEMSELGVNPLPQFVEPEREMKTAGLVL